jgi:hydroxyacylglutathione hydrolase
MILVKTFFFPKPERNFSYLVIDDKTGHAWVIDPFEALPIIEYIKKNSLVLQGILNTHQHWDHVKGNQELGKAFSAPLINLRSAEVIKLSESFSLETMDSPGHTLDHQVFIWKEAQIPRALFSGDTLFNSGVGNCKGGGDVNLLYETIQKLKLMLPKETLLYPGHDYRRRNLEFALSLHPEDQFIREELRRVSELTSEFLPASTLEGEQKVNPFLTTSRDEFIQLRLKRDHW